MAKVGVLHENARISRRFGQKLISFMSMLADFAYISIDIIIIIIVIIIIIIDVLRNSKAVQMKLYQ